MRDTGRRDSGWSMWELTPPSHPTHCREEKQEAIDLTHSLSPSLSLPLSPLSSRPPTLPLSFRRLSLPLSLSLSKYQCCYKKVLITKVLSMYMYTVEQVLIA